MEIPKVIIFAILALVTIAIIILLGMFFIGQGGGSGSMLLKYSDWKIWK